MTPRQAIDERAKTDALDNALNRNPAAFAHEQFPQH
jgi:hypothetical protein